jgi:hypothetical protein
MAGARVCDLGGVPPTEGAHRTRMLSISPKGVHAGMLARPPDVGAGEANNL